MSEKLLPCPFCGDFDAECAESAVPNVHGGQKYAVFCNACFCEGPTDDIRERAIAAWNRRELESASQPGGGEEEDIIEQFFKNPMTPYGMLVRALRIVAGTTMMDMSNHIGITPAHLSGIETARRPLFHSDVVAASGYFHGLGIPGTLIVLERAYSVSKNASIAATGAGNGEGDRSTDTGRPAQAHTGGEARCNRTTGCLCGDGVREHCMYWQEGA